MSDIQGSEKTDEKVDMRIGILTFHRSHNYGAQLQAYALSQTLQAFGHDVEFVDYRQPKVEEAFRLVCCAPYKKVSPINAAKIFVSRMITFLRRRARHNNFVSFSRRWLKKSPRYEPGKRFPAKYDVLVFGSDQIWTTRFLGDFDSILWGEVDIACTKMITYAPSMEMKDLTSSQCVFCESHLKNFENISVREGHMKVLLGRLTEKNMDVVLDPVFLRDKADYLKLSTQSRITLPSRYVLVYTIGKPSDEVNAIAGKVAAYLSLPVIYLCGEIGLSRDKSRLDTAGPVDFLKAFDCADFIVTTSFHGTAFSIIFEKPFYSIKKDGVSGRAEALLERVGLERAIVSTAPEADVPSYGTIDYDLVHTRILSMRAHSLGYLKTALS